MSALWADPLSQSERAELARKLLRATRRLGTASGTAKHAGNGILAMSLVLASGETAVLYTDVTERAREARS